ncbi:MAG: hypothetical protein KME19_06610 [Microcoleus vaginatus WJT46-NPBG5]|nr:hypothetical protein [Microcoleus vaginatus WJT46-NPBG5]
MQRILQALGQALRTSLVIVCLMTLIGVSGLFIFAPQPSYAATAVSKKPALPDPDVLDPQAGMSREQAYEEAVKEAQSETSIEKVYEENLEEYKEENPEPGLIQKAEEAIEKVTGND